MLKYLYNGILYIFLTTGFVGPGLAQEQVNKDSFSSARKKEERKYVKPTDKLKRVDFPALFFTSEEITLLREAVDSYRRGGKLEDGSEPSFIPPSSSEGEIDRGPREVILGGLLYLTSSDWTIWLNKERITPSALPEEILELKVYKDFVEIQWYDSYTNQIFPLRLRPHQRFNLDAKIFLP